MPPGESRNERRTTNAAEADNETCMGQKMEADNVYGEIHRLEAAEKSQTNLNPGLSKLDKTEKDLAEAKAGLEHFEAEAKTLEAAADEYYSTVQALKAENRILKNKGTAGTPRQVVRTFRAEELRKDAVRRAAEKDLMEKDLIEAKNQLALARREIQEANDRAKNAEEVERRLREMFGLAVVGRNDMAGASSFPTGEQILSNIQNIQKNAQIFLYELVCLRAKEEGRNRCTDQDYTIMIQEVLLPVATFSHEQYRAYVSKKVQQLDAFLEDSNRSDTELSKAFMLSTMQQLVHCRLEQGSVDVLGGDFETDSKLLEWAMSHEVVTNEDMDGTTVGRFAQDLHNLYLQCRFSKPRFYLYPEVGDAVEFSPDLHVQFYVSGAKAKPGDLVRVVYPGLYKGNPEEPRAVPVHKVLVLKTLQTEV